MPAVKTRVSVAFELVIALSIVTLPFSVQAGIFTGWLDDGAEAAKATPLPPVKESATDVELLSSTQNPDPVGGSETEILVEENALVSTGPVSEEDMAVQAESSDEISVYTVREGDSLSEIAQMFGVTSNTILWANDLKKKTDINPGDELIILPIAGVRHVVKSGDTIDTIAKKYGGEANDILSYNQLATVSEIAVGETLIIPGGELHTEVVTTTKGKSGKSAGKNSSGSAGFINPAPGAVKTQGIHGNNAVDLAGSMGLTIRAAAGGQVIIAKGGGGWNGGYGNYVVIKHSNGTQTLYAHLSSLSVGSGAYVEQGETIGGMGNTGKSTGTHLHFEVRGGRNPF
jgi:murein DD-endopeptidase MepM/ murein hydrolase activator NlpD